MKDRFYRWVAHRLPMGVVRHAHARMEAGAKDFGRKFEALAQHEPDTPNNQYRGPMFHPCPRCGRTCACGDGFGRAICADCAAARHPSPYDFLNRPEEDIYTREDGEPV